MIVFMLGFMGAGKSFLGRQLAKETGSIYIDLDDALVEYAGMSINQVFEKFGEDYFRKIETQVLHETTIKFLEDEVELDGKTKTKYCFIGCGGGTPCFNDNMKWMNQHGLTIWLNPPINVLFERLRNEKDQRPLLKGFDDDQLLNFIENKLAERAFFYDLSAVKLNENNPILSNILTKIDNA